MFENEARNTNCPWYGSVCCTNPYDCSCPEALSCDGLVATIYDWFVIYDTNGDGFVNGEDTVE
jgi:hypothetical protein